MHKITLLEASKIAGGASGKAGGLLALWAYPSDIVPLSFRLHAELAQTHDGEKNWGYRQVDCGQIAATGGMPSSKEGYKPQNADSVSLGKRDQEAHAKLRAAGLPNELTWISADCVSSYDAMAEPGETAQVHPYQFTTAMARLAEEMGVKIILGSVLTIGKTDRAVSSVIYEDKASLEKLTISATDVIIAAGPWTKIVYPSAPIGALRAHSVTIRPSKPLSAHAIFTEIRLPKSKNSAKFSKLAHGKTVTPEIYARPDGEAYACGEGDTLVPLPKTTEDVEVVAAKCQDIIDYVSSISDELKDGEVTTRQACYLPQVEAASGGPLIGKTGVKGLLMATGHTCWGIQNGPATGKLISEFVFDGNAKSASIGSLDPRKVL